MSSRVQNLDVPVRGRLVCRVNVKRAGDVIHVLDLDGDVSLTNAADRDLQRFIIEQLGIAFPPGPSTAKFTWVLYHTDSVVSLFDGSFAPAPAEIWDAEMAAAMNRLYGPSPGRYDRQPEPEEPAAADPALAEPPEGFKFSVVDVESGDVMFSRLYGDEYLEDAFSQFIADVGGLELGQRLEIVEVVLPDAVG